jgi:hypothetical protein
MRTASELEWLRVQEYLRENRHALGIRVGSHPRQPATGKKFPGPRVGLGDPPFVGRAEAGIRSGAVTMHSRGRRSA